MSQKNLNLLSAFDALMKDKQVSSAADRMHISQSAMSKKLEQLRVQFQNPLFIRTPTGMEATCLANELYPKIQTILSLSDEIFNLPATFSAKNFSKELYIGMPNSIADFLLPVLTEAFRSDAPNIKLHIRDINANNLHDRLSKNEIHLAITYGLHLPEQMKASSLIKDDVVCLARRNHKILRHPKIPIKEYLENEHIVLIYDEISNLSGDIFLKNKGYPARKIAMTVPSALTALTLLQKSDSLFSINKQFAMVYAKKFNLEFRLMPTFTPPVQIKMVWSPMISDSLWHQWLREYIKNLCLKKLP